MKDITHKCICGWMGHKDDLIHFDRMEIIALKYYAYKMLFKMGKVRPLDKFYDFLKVGAVACPICRSHYVIDILAYNSENYIKTSSIRCVNCNLIKQNNEKES